MLRLVLGRSKSGKTEYVRNYLASLAKNGKGKLLMIVPDQQTFDTEKAFLNILGPKLSHNVLVMGFSRLCRFVFEQSEYIPSTFADDSVKSLLMSIALEDTADVLKMYNKGFESSAVISMFLDLHAELMRNKSDISELGKKQEALTDVLRDKLHDINTVLSAYDALLAQSFEDPDGELSVAYDLLIKNKLFEGFTICLDSFLSFSELEYDILERLMIESEEMLVTLSDDGINNPDSIFAVSQETASRLKSIAKNNFVKIAANHYCDYNQHFKSQDLSLIEENAFRFYNSSEEKYSTYVTPQNIEIYAASDAYDEADYVARNIKRLVMEEGYRYSDFAVVCRELSPYRNIIDNAFTSYDISHFIDTPKNVLSSPLMKLISACFECVRSAFHKDSVLAVLKSGLVDVDEIDSALFENYIFTWSLSGVKLLSEFTANPRGFADEFTTEDLLELTRCEKVRSFMLTPLQKFKEEIKDATAEQIAKSLYELLLSLKVTEKISALSQMLLSDGELRLSEEQLRLWDVFVETLDRTVQVMGNRRVRPKNFSELLKLQFLSLELAYIPRAVDEVIVGDIERLRLTDKKIVFVIGAVEGEFPKVSQTNGIFTNSERHLLTDVGILSDASLELQYTRERYHCYYALTSASEKLFVSYSISDLSGEQKLPSELIGELLSLFENMKIKSYTDIDTIDRLWSSKQSFGVFASRVGSTDSLTEALDEYYSRNDDFGGAVNSLKKAVSKEPFKIESKTTAELLFGKDMRLSATQVETFHLCRFRYFCNYGLRLRERRIAEMNPMEYGSYVHYILEHFVKNHTKDEMSAMTPQDIDNEITSIMEDYAQKHLGGFSDKSQRFMYLFTRIKGSLRILVEHLIKELLQSKFIPDAFELEIGKDVPAYTLELSTGDKVIIRGKVDRADVFEKDGKKYIRIVDYKTGSKVFSLSDIMYGLNLQMLIYLSVLSRSKTERYGDDIVPAGVLYSPALVPVLSADATYTKDKIDNEMDKALRMNGLILNDKDILSAMDANISGVFIPVSVKGDTLSGDDNLATLGQFGAIFARIDEMIGEMAKELKEGFVDATPAVGGYNACDYCPYVTVCRHTEGDPVKYIFKLDRQRILEELKCEEEEGAR